MRSPLTSFQLVQAALRSLLGHRSAPHIDLGQGPDDEHVVLADPEGNEFCIIEPTNNFLADCGRLGSIAPKTGKNRLRPDIAPSDRVDQRAAVGRLVSLGATRLDIGQGEVDWVVMADPDDNEFRVVSPRSDLSRGPADPRDS